MRESVVRGGKVLYNKQAAKLVLSRSFQKDGRCAGQPEAPTAQIFGGALWPTANGEQQNKLELPGNFQLLPSS
jgi:hypothetical protein